MNSFAVFRRWPIATWLFLVHAVFVALIYILWATSSDVERGMIWMTVFLFDLPSSLLFVDLPDAKPLLAISAIFIGGLQWALLGAFLDVLRKGYRRRQSLRGTQNT